MAIFYEKMIIFMIKNDRFYDFEKIIKIDQFWDKNGHFWKIMGRF
jgi:hypothetical protein